MGKSGLSGDAYQAAILSLNCHFKNILAVTFDYCINHSK